MAYVGQIAPIPLGNMGLKTDDSMTNLPPNSAIKANNVRFTYSRLEKSGGSRKLNSSAFDAGVVGVSEWVPSAGLQRTIAVTSNGKVYRDTGSGTFNSNTAIATLTGTLDQDVCFAAGGAEASGNNRKLFIFTNSLNQIQVLDGDGTSLSAIDHPSADWSASNYPTFGLIYQNRLAVLRGHNLYFSTTTDHEKFDGTSTECPIFSIFPGEGEGLVSAINYKGTLFLFKKPYGVYYIQTNGSASPADWSVERMSDSFGAASPHCAIQMLDDLVVANSSGSITSLRATQAFGGLENGDILSNAQIEQYVKSQLTAPGISKTHALWYPEKKIALFTGRSLGAVKQDRMLVVDVTKQNPKFSIETKDQPTCLGLRKDSNNIPRPIYGSATGFVYIWDDSSYRVGDSTSYIGEFQTPYIDFAYLDPSLGNKTKLFDALAVHFVGTGSWNFYIDVYIDNRFSETLTFGQDAGSALDSFVLDTDVLSVEYTQQNRKPLHGSGERISFRIYNNVVNQYFKIEKLTVSFRVGAEQQKATSGVFSL